MKLSIRKNAEKCSFSLKAVLMLVLLILVLSVAASAATVYTDGNFKYTLSNSKATVTGYVEEINGVLSIPGTLGGYPVTAVGENAFAECAGITHLVLPDTCTLIGKKAFLRCESLESIDLPEGLKTVGYQSFHSCTSLKSVTIPDSVTRFAYSPFGNCTALEEIVFSPDSLLEIVGEDAFFNCRSLKSFTLPKNVNTEYEGMFRSCTSLESVTINAELPSIPMYMFDGCKNLKSVTFEEGSKVTAVCKRAFSRCELLSSITLPESIETIDTLAFEKCIMLSDVKIKSLSAYICEDAFTDTAVYNDVGDWTDGVLYIDGYLIKADTELSGDYVIPDGTKEIAEAAFLRCRKLTSVTIPDGITVIPKRAFENCTLMKNAELPDGIKVIDSQAFYQCMSLERFRLPLSLESVNNWAFGFCVNLLTLEHYGKEIYVENYSGNFGAPNYCAYKFINLAEGTTSYRYTPDKNGFVFKRVGDSIQLVAYVGDEDTVTLPEDYNGKPYTIFYLKGVKNVIIPETITEIPQHAFEECTTLESVTLHSNVYTIRDWAFGGCFNLKKIVLSEHLSAIMNNAFASCSSLDNVVIPAGVHTIGNYAFTSCSSLDNVVIPAGVHTIGNNAFSSCSRLKSFSFAPNSRLTEINANVFSGCKSLEKIKLPDTIEKISTYAFDGTLYYNNEENWEDGVLYLDEYLISGKKCEGEELVIKDGTRVIALNAFSNADQLKKVTLPASIEIIGDDAFTSCVQLYEVYNNSKFFIVPGSSEYGGVAASAYIVYDGFGNPLLKENCYMTPDDFVFEYLDGVYYLRLYLGDEQSITLPSSYKGNSYVIKNMKGNATEITVPSVFDTISEYAFSPNKTLKKINLPSTVTKIDNYAFAFCSSLEEINLPDSITYIGESAFYCCALKSLDLPSGIKSINDWAFYSCIYIEEVVIPSGVTEIGCSAFYNCFDLKRVTVPATVQSIDAYAFHFCESLESLTFEKGSAISSIGMGAFPNEVDIYLYCYSNSFMSDYAEKSNCYLYYVDLDAFRVYFDGISLVLDGTIGMKFYFKVPEVIVPYITFSAAQRLDSSHTLISYNEYTTKNGINKEQTQLVGARVYTACSAVVPIAPKDALESYLTVKVSCGDKYDIISSIRVSDYISSFRDMAESSSEYSEALELVDAMETYIECAAAYFTDEEYTDTVELVDNGLDTVPAPTKSGSAKGITHQSTSLLLEGETTLRHYFKIDGATVTIFKLGDLYLTPVHLGENIYCVDIQNISADELDTVYTVSVNGTLELSCSVLNYVKAAIDSSDTRLAELAKSLYNYHCSAKKYAE